MSRSGSRPFVIAVWILALILPLGAAPAWPASQLFDGTWSALGSGGNAPPARRELAAVYDNAHQRFLVFGGLYTDYKGGYQLFNEIWSLSLGLDPTWSLLQASGPAPGQRHSPQWGYDPARNRVLMFGGYGSHDPGGPYEYLNDIWELELASTPEWKELTPAGTAPSGRLAGASVYDVLRQRFVGFGGTVGLPVDTWQLDLSGDDPVWSTVQTDSTGPPGGYGMTSIFDPVRNRMLIFGGSISDGYWGVHNNLWELDLVPETPAWKQLDPAGPLPSARRTLASIYDFLRDRMVIFGGWDNLSDDPSSFLNDTWALSLSGPLEWTQLQPDGTLPSGRDAMAAAYDPLGDRMVVFGGWSGLTVLGDTQFLSWGGLGQSASMTATTEAEPGVARVVWSVQNATGPHAGVYRRQAGTPWSAIATVLDDGSGSLRFEDHSVTPGGRYGYLVVVPSERGDALGGEVWVDVPTTTGADPGATTAFALRGVQPNPVMDRLVVAFSLSSGDPARLELMDLAGRRVLERQVGSLGAGTHRLDLGGAREFAPGMYFLRLAQGSRSQTARVVIGN